MHVASRAREKRARRAAQRQGLALRKSRKRDPRSLDFDRWLIEGEDGGVIAGASSHGRPS